MNSINSIATSGLAAAMLNQSVSAHNVANVMTPEFRRQRVIQETQQGGGVSATVVQSDESGNELAADTMRQAMSFYTFKANLRVVQTEHEMLGTLLDVKA